MVKMAAVRLFEETALMSWIGSLSILPSWVCCSCRNESRSIEDDVLPPNMSSTFRKCCFSHPCFDLSLIVEEHVKASVFGSKKLEQKTQKAGSLEGRGVIQLPFGTPKHVVTVIVCTRLLSIAPDFACPFQHELILGPHQNFDLLLNTH